MSIESELVNVDKLLKTEKLKIPEYQRPYRWREESARQLYRDVDEARKKMLDGHIAESEFRYRLGTVILHKAGENYHIVDGQQRITTLVLLLKCLDEKWTFPSLKYTALSRNAIMRNYLLFRRLVTDLDGKEKEKYKEFLLENCQVVKLVVSELPEAFQLFDSQNSRGKALAPHDLLKAYHLREMRELSRERMVEIVREWEGIKLDRLRDFFNFNLHPLVNWHKGKDGLDFDKAKIGEFKGIRKKGSFNASRYHFCAYAFMDEVNARLKNINSDEYGIFQLTQPVVAGEKFFKFVFHYWKLLKGLETRIEEFNSKYKIALLERGRGDAYINYLLKNVLMFYADRFNVESITESVYRKILGWCYYLRISLYAVRKESINNYALGRHEENKGAINLFEAISEMAEPVDILGIDVPVPEIEGKKDVYKEIKDYCWPRRGNAN